MKHSKKYSKKHSKKHSRKYTKKKNHNKLSSQLNTQALASYEISKYRETDYLKSLIYEPPLLKYKLTSIDINNLRDDKSTVNYTKYISKYDYNTNNNLQFNPDNFQITYKINKI